MVPAAKNHPAVRLTSPLLMIALWSSVAEFLVARTLSRVTIFIPHSGAAALALGILADVGRWLLALAFLAATALVAVLSASLVRRRRPWSQAAGFLTTLQLAFAVGAIAAPGLLTTVAFASGSLALYLLLLLPITWGRRVWLAATIGTAYALSVSYTLWTVASQGFGAAPPAPEALLRFAEVFAMAATIPLFRAYAWDADVPGAMRPKGRPVLVATAVTALFAFLVTLSPAIVAAVATFALGFSLFLAPAFAAALWLYAVATVHQLGHAQTRFTGYGLVWLGIAGLQLQLSHQYLLATLALLMLATGGLAGLLPAPARTPGPQAREAATASAPGDPSELRRPASRLPR